MINPKFGRIGIAKGLLKQQAQCNPAIIRKSGKTTRMEWPICETVSEKMPRWNNANYLRTPIRLVTAADFTSAWKWHIHECGTITPQVSVYGHHALN